MRCHVVRTERGDRSRHNKEGDFCPLNSHGFASDAFFGGREWPRKMPAPEAAQQEQALDKLAKGKRLTVKEAVEAVKRR